MDWHLNTPTHALDRSLRSTDADGIMRVEMSRISKANICPYWGREIPGWEALGLIPDKSYKLFRDPKELEKAASTFDGKPLLIKHVAVTADLPNKSLWVGTIGACTFEDPYLITRPLTVITREAQELIEEDEQRELSAGYRYTAEMIPGVYGGERYDGRMVGITGNHVALVIKGRAGPDVLVADELPLELSDMKRRAELVNQMYERLKGKGLLAGTVSRMAFDAALGETPAKSVVKLTGDEEKAACDEALAEKRKTAGEDAELSDEERESAMQKARDKKGAKDKAKDADPKEEKGEDEEYEAEDEEEEDDPKPKAKDKAKDKDRDDDPDHRDDFKSIKQGKDKAKDKAMDSAMALDAAAVQKLVRTEAAKVREQVVTQQRAFAVAIDEVAPLVGKLRVHAFDADATADDVYKKALNALDVDIEDVHPSAYRALVKNEVKHRQTARKPANKHAMDSAAGGFDADSLFQRVG